jgi:hypothetical protein
VVGKDGVMTNAIKVDTMVDQALAQAVPALRPLIGKRVELIAIEAESAQARMRKLTLDELLEQRIDAPPGSRPLTEDDIRRAIIEGALNGNV